VQRVEARSVIHEEEAYQVIDRSLNTQLPVLYYRLKTVLTSGKVNYSAVIPVLQVNKPNDSISLFPNPVRSSMTVGISVSSNARAVMDIIDLNGRIHFRASQVLVKGNTTIELNHAVNLPEGMYIFRVQYNGMILTRKFNKLQ